MGRRRCDTCIILNHLSTPSKNNLAWTQQWGTWTIDNSGQSPQLGSNNQWAQGFYPGVNLSTSSPSAKITCNYSYPADAEFMPYVLIFTVGNSGQGVGKVYFSGCTMTIDYRMPQYIGQNYGYAGAKITIESGGNTSQAFFWQGYRGNLRLTVLQDHLEIEDWQWSRGEMGNQGYAPTGFPTFPINAQGTEFGFGAEDNSGTIMFAGIQYRFAGGYDPGPKTCYQPAHSPCVLCFEGTAQWKYHLTIDGGAYQYDVYPVGWQTSTLGHGYCYFTSDLQHITIGSWTWEYVHVLQFLGYYEYPYTGRNVHIASWCLVISTNTNHPPFPWSGGNSKFYLEAGVAPIDCNGPWTLTLGQHTCEVRKTA